MEESDERDGFSMGGVKVRVGSTREGRMSGGVSERLPARDRVGLDNGVRVRDEATELVAREEFVAVAVSVQVLEQCSKWELDDGGDVVDLEDERHAEKEESSVYAVVEDSAGAEWGKEGGGRLGKGGEGILGDM